MSTKTSSVLPHPTRDRNVTDHHGRDDESEVDHQRRDANGVVGQRQRAVLRRRLVRDVDIEMEDGADGDSEPHAPRRDRHQTNSKSKVGESTREEDDKETIEGDAGDEGEASEEERRGKEASCLDTNEQFIAKRVKRHFWHV